MKPASTILSRIASAALAAACSLGIVAVLGQQLDPSRLAVSPQIVELDRVVISAPAPAAVATLAGSIAAN